MLIERTRPTNPVMVRAGRKIVLIIAAVHIIVSIVGFFVNLYTHYFLVIPVAVIIFQVAVTVAMIQGWNMARYFIGLNTAVWAISAGVAIFTMPLWTIFLYIPAFLYAVYASALLFTSKNVCEYMYEKNEGW